MAVLILVAICLVVGLLMYLPFWLWFRRQRRRGKSTENQIRYTRSGYLMMLVTLAALLGGLAIPRIAPGSWVAAQIDGEHGVLRWAICVATVFGVVEMMLRRAGVVFSERRSQKDLQQGTGSSTAAGLGRRWKVVNLRGVPVFIDASLPIGGLLVAFLANGGLVESASYCIAFVVLIFVHELGHFAAARALGLRVFAINISGLGGSCLMQLPRGVRDTAILFSGGLGAQAVLLALTLIAVAVTGNPESAIGTGIVETFTVVNLVVAAVNLVPGKFGDDLSNDGAVLWDLLLHAAGRGPHPFAKEHAASPLLPPETSLMAVEGMMPPDFRVGVELLNDDGTPMEFVVSVLEKHLGLDREAAAAAMLCIHTQGGLLLPMTDDARAEAAANIVTQEARDRGFPLICRSVRAPHLAPPDQLRA